MSAATPPPQRTGRESLYACLGAFLLQVLVVYPCLDVLIAGLEDEGFTLFAAAKLASGCVPYRDYFDRIMPATPFLISLGYRLWGLHILVGRLYFVFMTGVLAATVEYCSCRLLPRYWSELPVLCFIAVGAQAWPMPSFHWDANIFALASLALLARGRPGRFSTWRAMLPFAGAGLLAGVAVLFLQTKGLAVILGISTAIWLSPWPRSDRWRAWSRAVLGGLAVGLPFALYLAWEGAFPAFLRDTVGFNSKNYVGLQAHGLDLSPLVQEASVLWQGLGQWGKIGWMDWLGWFGRALAFLVVDLVKFGAFYPVVALGCAVALVLRSRGSEGEQLRLFRGLVATLACASLLDLVRPNRYHLGFQTPLWFPVFWFLLAWGAGRWRKGAATLLGLAFLVHGLDNYTSWDQYQYPVGFPRGVLRMNDLGLARESAQRVAYLSRRWPAPRACFGFPDASLQQFLLGYDYALAYPHAIPLQNSPEQVQEIRRQLVAARMPLLLFLPVNPVQVHADYPRVSAEAFARAQEELLRVLTEGYRPQWSSGSLTVYEREP